MLTNTMTFSIISNRLLNIKCWNSPKWFFLNVSVNEYTEIRSRCWFHMPPPKYSRTYFSQQIHNQYNKVILNNTIHFFYKCFLQQCFIYLSESSFETDTKKMCARVSWRFCINIFNCRELRYFLVLSHANQHPGLAFKFMLSGLQINATLTIEKETNKYSTNQKFWNKTRIFSYNL